MDQSRQYAAPLVTIKSDTNEQRWGNYYFLITIKNDGDTQNLKVGIAPNLDVCIFNIDNNESIWKVSTGLHIPSPSDYGIRNHTNASSEINMEKHRVTAHIEVIFHFWIRVYFVLNDTDQTIRDLYYRYTPNPNDTSSVDPAANMGYSLKKYNVIRIAIPNGDFDVNLKHTEPMVALSPYASNDKSAKIKFVSSENHSSTMDDAESVGRRVIMQQFDIENHDFISSLKVCLFPSWIHIIATKRGRPQTRQMYSFRLDPLVYPLYKIVYGEGFQRGEGFQLIRYVFGGVEEKSAVIDLSEDQPIAPHRALCDSDGAAKPKRKRHDYLDRDEAIPRGSGGAFANHPANSPGDHPIGNSRDNAINIDD